MSPIKTYGGSNYYNQEVKSILITDIIKNSYEKDDIIMSDEIYEVMNELRDYMFKNIYASESSAKSEEVKAEGVIENLFYTYMNHLLHKKLI